MEIMGYLNLANEKTIEESKLLTWKIWLACKADVEKKLTRRGLKVILYAVHNIWDEKLMKYDSN